MLACRYQNNVQSHVKLKAPKSPECKDYSAYSYKLNSGKKNYVLYSLEYIPLYLGTATQMAIPWQSFTTVPTRWANDIFGLNLEFELHLEGVEQFWVQQHRQIHNTAVFS